MRLVAYNAYTSGVRAMNPWPPRRNGRLTWRMAATDKGISFILD